MSYDLIRVEQKGRVGLITLNRPKQLNALSPQLMQELGAALHAFDAREDVGAILITGNERAFAAGADIAAMKDYSYMDAFMADYITRDWEHIRRIRKPVIAAVAGYALGGGNELAMMCDIVVAADNARFGQPEVNLAVMPGAGGTQRLPRLIGQARATEMIFEAKRLRAQDALRIGLVNAAFPPESFQAAVADRAAALARSAPIALRLAKEAIIAGMERAPGKAYEVEAENFGRTAMTEDAAVGIMSFVAKQKPEFSGK